MKMRSKLLTAVLVLAFAAGLFGAAYAQDKATGKAPKAVIENKTIQLGEVMEGLDFTYTFTIKNVGDAELQVLNVKPG